VAGEWLLSLVDRYSYQSKVRGQIFSNLLFIGLVLLSRFVRCVSTAFCVSFSWCFAVVAAVVVCAELQRCGRGTTSVTRGAGRGRRFV
jgi:hypothetical protein